jgi:phosphoribosyl-AMP cyclohydrolase
VVVQEATSGAVLLRAYLNTAALAATMRTGREQIVEGLYVNCEQISLLLRVHQQGGAACHTGHPTCFYRRLAPDDSWQVVEERVFDPAEVYGRAPSSVHDSV